MKGRTERFNGLAVRIAAEWNLWNEAAKGFEVLQKAACQFKSERLTVMKLLWCVRKLY